MQSPNPISLWYEGALVPPAACSHPSPFPSRPHLHKEQLAGDIFDTSSCLSLRIAAFHLWQLIAERWGKGTRAKATQLRCLLTNHIYLPP